MIERQQKILQLLDTSGPHLHKLLVRLTQQEDVVGEAMIIVRLVGIAVEKKILNGMISLYTTMNNQKKLRTTEKQLQEVEAEAAQIKRWVDRLTNQHLNIDN